MLSHPSSGQSLRLIWAPPLDEIDVRVALSDLRRGSYRRPTAVILVGETARPWLEDPERSVIIRLVFSLLLVAIAIWLFLEGQALKHAAERQYDIRKCHKN